jgi:hypothetical protein
VAGLAVLGCAWVLAQRALRPEPTAPRAPELAIYQPAPPRSGFDDPPPPPTAEELRQLRGEAPGPDAGLDAAGLPGDVAGDAGLPGPSDAAAPVPTPDAAGNGGAASPPPRRDPRPPPALPPLPPVVLVVSPANSEVRVGEGPWQRVAQRLSVPIESDSVRVTVRNDACCESQSRVLTRGNAGGQVAISLDFLAAQIVPRCAAPGVEVKVDGKLARLDSPASIPFGATTRTQRAVVVEFIGDRIDRHEVTVHPASQQEVTCALP